MKIGIVSDSHGRGDRLQSAMEAFASRGVQAVVHCGDIGSTQCVEALSSIDAATYAVAGNVDAHVKQLGSAAATSGVTFAWEVVEVPLGDGQHLVATHGCDQEVLEELIRGEQFPYVCHGHTHRVRDERIGPVRVINPGALRSPKAPKHPSAAILDTDGDPLEFIALKR